VEIREDFPLVNPGERTALSWIEMYNNFLNIKEEKFGVPTDGINESVFFEVN